MPSPEPLAEPAPALAAQVRTVMQTRFKTFPMMAGALLDLLNPLDRDARLPVLALVLSEFDLERVRGEEVGNGHMILLQEAYRQNHPPCVAFVKDVMVPNLSVAAAAERLDGLLWSVHEQTRLVRMAILLQTNLFPYAPMPPEAMASLKVELVEPMEAVGARARSLALSVRRMRIMFTSDPAGLHLALAMFIGGGETEGEKRARVMALLMDVSAVVRQETIEDTVAAAATIQRRARQAAPPGQPPATEPAAPGSGIIIP